jgi:hypothetical protein
MNNDTQTARLASILHYLRTEGYRAEYLALKIALRNGRKTLRLPTSCGLLAQLLLSHTLSVVIPIIVSPESNRYVVYLPEY